MSKKDITIPQLRCTIFPDVKAQQAKEVDFDLRFINGEIEAPGKHSLPLFKLARFGDRRSPKNALRFDENVIAISGAELDYDAGDLDFREAMTRLEDAGIFALGYTSPSYSREHPKWRIVLPFSHEYTGDLATLKAISTGAVATAEDVLGVVFPSESKKLSQSFFFGRALDAEEYDWAATTGKPVDVLHPDLPQIGFLSSGQDDTASTAERIEQTLTGENYHESHLTLSSRWAALGMGREEMTASLQGMMQMAPDAGTPRWQQRYDDIPRIVESALAKFARPSSDFTPPTQEKSQRRRHIRPLADITDLREPAPPLVWSVDKLVPQGALALFTGAPGTGKSFALMEMQVATTLGLPFYGMDAQRHRTVYIGAEDHRDSVYKRRLQARIAMDPDSFDVDLFAANAAYYHPPTDFEGSFLLTTKAGPDPEALDWLTAELQGFGDTSLPLIVFIDPLMSFFGGESENSSADMQALITFLRRLSSRLDATIVICHHDAKGQDTVEDVGDKMGRGSSAAFGGVRSGFRLWKPTAEKIREHTGLRVDPEDARYGYVALSQGKSNYGEFMRTMILRRGAGGVLVPVAPISTDESNRDGWGMVGFGVEAYIMEHGSLRERDVKRNTNRLLQEICAGENLVDSDGLLKILAWAAKNGFLNEETYRNGGLGYTL